MLKSKIDNGSKIIGILGAGQLAKMLANDAYRMGLRVAVIENKKGSPTTDMTKLDFSDDDGWEARLDDFVNNVDIVTLENEFLDPEILSRIEKKKPVYPSSETLKLVQDKFIQKNTFKKAGQPLPRYDKVDSVDEAKAFGEKYNYPFVLKSRKYGYDGYGNETVKSEDDVEQAFKNLTKNNKSGLLAEAFVNFKAELAVMVARNVDGDVKVYPCVETVQKDHICHKVIAPVEAADVIKSEAQEIAVKCVESINGVGVFGVEMFWTRSDEVLVNEIAPRPHNSGHYTIEGCYTSQFENAIRAINNLPLGNTELVKGAACMINLLGEREGSGVPKDVTKMLQNNASLHLYNKSDSRVGRKMGHITAIGKTTREAHKIASKAVEDFNW